MKRVLKNKIKVVKRIPIKQDPACAMWFNKRFQEMVDEDTTSKNRGK